MVKETRLANTVQKRNIRTGKQAWRHRRGRVWTRLRGDPGTALGLHTWERNKTESLAGNRAAAHGSRSTD